jgi:hypothetical protein
MRDPHRDCEFTIGDHTALRRKLGSLDREAFVASVD